MTEQRDLEGLSALVTGATSGIGRAAAEELGRRGAEVVVHGRNPARGSLAWVQMIACGPLAMTVERTFFSNAGSLLLVAS
jgi:NAD(P)-dependent dehydrogenase (short-subunit alcohol dehydrogenase family)